MKLALAILLAAAPGAAEEEAGRASQFGGLHRAAATLESALDFYRLALIDLVPAVRLVAEAGTHESAAPETPIPAAAQEVFTRIARSIAQRVPEAPLPATARAYHSEVLDALERLARATSIGAVLGPTRDLHGALGRFAGQAQSIVDLFSRERPIIARVLDESVYLEETEVALEELQRAEVELEAVRRQQGSFDEVAARFRRLELALGHVLDLYAASRQAGFDLTAPAGGSALEVGLNVAAPLSTKALEAILERVRIASASLDASLRQMEQSPPPVSGLRAELTEKEAKSEARLSWQPVLGPPLLRIYRIYDVAGTQERLRAAHLCDGKSDAEARSLAEQQAGELAGPPLLAGEVASGRGAVTDVIGTEPIVPPRYRVVAVSPFGVESAAAVVTAKSAPVRLAGPMLPRASIADPAPDSREFYLRAGEVTVSWMASRSDLRHSRDLLAFADREGLPQVTAYAIERESGGRTTDVVTVPAGVTSYVDRPSMEDLAVGVRYRVTAIGSDGSTAAPPAACAWSAAQLLDLGGALALARAGAAFVQHPTRWERELLASWQEPELFAEARAAFVAKPAAERKALLARWWSSLSLARRTAWLRRWPELMSQQEREGWTAAWDGTLSDRDLQLAQASLYLAELPELRQEVERWWSLLDTAARQAALAGWKGSLNAAHRAEVEARQRADAKSLATVEAPARLLAWWSSRDPIQQAALARWWRELDSVRRSKGLAAWFAQLSPIERSSVRWPDWERRSDAERKELLRDGWLQLPAALERPALARAAWESLSGEARLAAVRAEVGRLGTALAALRFWLRPLDAALAFRGAAALMLLAIAGLIGSFLYMRLVKRRERSSRSASPLSPNY